MACGVWSVRGVNWFDTADSYGTGALEGRAEVLLGEFIRAHQYKAPGVAREEEVRVATKLAPYPWRIGKDSYVRAAEGSLKRLERDVLDVAQLHWAPPLGWQEQEYWAALAQLYTSGKARAVGLSNYGPKQLAKAHAGLKALGAPLASNQVSERAAGRREARPSAWQLAGADPHGSCALRWWVMTGAVLPGEHAAGGERAGGDRGRAGGQAHRVQPARTGAAHGPVQRDVPAQRPSGADLQGAPARAATRAVGDGRNLQAGTRQDLLPGERAGRGDAHGGLLIHCSRGQCMQP